MKEINLHDVIVDSNSFSMYGFFRALKPHTLCVLMQLEAIFCSHTEISIS